MPIEDREYMPSKRPADFQLPFISHLLFRAIATKLKNVFLRLYCIQGETGDIEIYKFIL
jgi:hypothetical protein